jgi:acyl carrier protein
VNADTARKLAVQCLVQVAPDIDPVGLDDDADLREDLDLDSMDILNFVTGLSELTGVDIPERDYPQLETIRRCVEYVAAHT